MVRWNIGKHTAGSTTAALFLGFSPESIMILNHQPAVKLASIMAENSGRSALTMSKHSKKKGLDTIINEMIKEMEARSKGVEFSDEMFVELVNVSADGLLAAMDNEDVTDPRFWASQVKALQVYKALNSFSNSRIKPFLPFFKLNQGMTPTAGFLFEFSNQIREMEEKEYLEGSLSEIRKVAPHFDAYNKFAKSLLKKTVDNFYSDDYYQKGFYLLDTFSSSGNRDAAYYKAILSFLNQTAVASYSMEFKGVRLNTPELRLAFLQFVEGTVRNLKVDEQFKGNKFIKRLQPKNWGGAYDVDFDISGTRNQQVKAEVAEGALQLFEQRPDVMRMLMLVNLMSKGANFGANSYAEFLPTEAYHDLSAYVDSKGVYEGKGMNEQMARITSFMGENISLTDLSNSEKELLYQFYLANPKYLHRAKFKKTDVWKGQYASFDAPTNKTFSFPLTWEERFAGNLKKGKEKDEQAEQTDGNIVETNFIYPVVSYFGKVFTYTGKQTDAVEAMAGKGANYANVSFAAGRVGKGLTGNSSIYTLPANLLSAAQKRKVISIAFGNGKEETIPIVFDKLYDNSILARLPKDKQLDINILGFPAKISRSNDNVDNKFIIDISDLRKKSGLYEDVKKLQSEINTVPPKQTKKQKFSLTRTPQDVVNLQAQAKAIEKVLPGTKVHLVTTEWLNENGFDGTALGIQENNNIYLNMDVAAPDTLLHEAGHILASLLKASNPALYEKLGKEAKETDVFKQIQQVYINLTEEEQIEEAIVTLIGFYGSKSKQWNEVGRSNRFLNVLKNLLKDAWNYLKGIVGINTTLLNKLKNVNDMTLAELGSLFSESVVKREKVAKQVNVKGINFSKNIATSLSNLHPNPKLREMELGTDAYYLTMAESYFGRHKVSEDGKQILVSKDLEGKEIWADKAGFLKDKADKYKFFAIKDESLTYAFTVGVSQLVGINPDSFIQSIDRLGNQTSIAEESEAFRATERSKKLNYFAIGESITEGGPEYDVKDMFIVTSNDKFDLAPNGVVAIKHSNDVYTLVTVQSVMENANEGLPYGSKDDGTLLHTRSDKQSIARLNLATAAVAIRAQNPKATFDSMRRLTVTKGNAISIDEMSVPDLNRYIEDVKKLEKTSNSSFLSEPDNVKGMWMDSSHFLSQSINGKNDQEKIRSVIDMFISVSKDPSLTKDDWARDPQLQQAAKFLLSFEDDSMKYGNMTDVNVLVQYLGGIYDTKNPIHQWVNRAFNDANVETGKKVADLKHDFSVLKDKLKAERGIAHLNASQMSGFGDFQENLYDFMWDRDDNGNHTGTLISPSKALLLKLPAEKAMYDYVVKKLSESLDLVGENRFDATFAPIVPKKRNNLLDYASERFEALKKRSFKNLGKDLFEYIENSAYDENIGKNATYAIPMKYLPTGKAEMAIATGNYDRDIERVLQKFYAFTNRKSSMEPVVARYVAARIRLESMTTNGQPPKRLIAQMDDWFRMQVLRVNKDDVLLDDDGRVVNTNTVLKKLKKYTALTILGFNFFGFALNSLQAEKEILLESAIKNHSAADRRFSFESYYQAQGIVAQDLAQQLMGKVGAAEGRTKIYQLMAAFQLDQDLFQLEMANNEDAILSSRLLTLGYSAGEYKAKATLMVAQMIEMNTWNDYQLDDTGKLAYMPYKNSRGTGKNSEGKETTFLLARPSGQMDNREIGTLRNVIAKILGGYSYDQQRTLAQNGIGELVLMMRKWIPDVMGRYFSTGYENDMLGHYEIEEYKEGDAIKHREVWQKKYVEGVFISLYRSFADKVTGKKTIAEMLNGKTTDKVQMVRLENLKRAGYDATLALALFAISAILTGDDEDEEEDVVLRMVDRFMMDNLSVYNPNFYLRQTSNVSAVIGQITNATTFAKQLLTLEREKGSGNYKFASTAFKIVPIAKPAKELYDFFEDEE